MKVILASASARRREILKHLNISFDIVVSNVDEKVLPNFSTEINAMNLAYVKARDVYQHLAEENVLVISADTMVDIEGEILGKPRDIPEARSMIRMLSGKKHRVITGYTLLSKDFCYVDHECTSVWFRDLSNERVENYIHTKEPYDKAGGYGIQDLGTLLVEKIEGDYLNVVGLPISKIYEVLNRHYSIRLLDF